MLTVRKSLTWELPVPARLVVVMLCALTTLFVAPPAAPTPADPGGGDVAAADPAPIRFATDPGLTGFTDLLVDDARGRLFISTGADVVITDRDGARSDALPLRATDLAMGTLGTELYASLPHTHQIAAVDLTTLHTRTYDLAVDVCPQRVAASLTAVWFVDRCSGRRAGVRGLDLVTGEVVDARVDVGSDEHIMSVHAEPQAPATVLVVSAKGSAVDPIDPYPHPLGVIRAYTAPVAAGLGLTFRASVLLRGQGGDDVAITPDGGHVVTAAEGRIPMFRTADLARAGSTGFGGRLWTARSAIAVRADGTVAAGYGVWGDVELFGLTSEYYASETLASGNNYHLPRSLRFGGDRLYAVTNSNRGGYRLHVSTPPAPPVVLTGGLTSYTDVEIDEPGGHIFIGQGRRSVAVTDLDGQPVGDIATGYATELAAGDGGDTVYAALPDSSAVAAIDTTTLAVRRIELPPDVCPVDVAFAADLLWVSDGCAHPLEALHAVDPVDGSVTRGLAPGGSGLLSAASQPDIVVACHQRPRYSYDEVLTVHRVVAGDEPELVSLGSADQLRCAENVQLRADAPGLHVGRHTYTLDMTPAPAFDPLDYLGEVAAAQRHDGVVVLGGRFSYPVGYDFPSREVAVFRPGSDRPSALGPVDDGWLVDWDVAAIRMGHDDAYVVVRDLDSQPVVIKRFDPDDATTPPLESWSRISIDVPDDVTAGVPFDVRVHLENGEPRGEVVIRLRTVDPFVWDEVARGRVNAAGDLVVPLTVTRSGDLNVYHAGGDGTTRAVAGVRLEPRAAVGVRPLGARRRVGQTFVYDARAAVRVATTLMPADRRRCVTLRLQRLVSGRWSSAGTRCVRVDSHGRAFAAVRSPSFTAGRTVRLRAEWPTTDRARSGVSRWVLTRFVRPRR